MPKDTSATINITITRIQLLAAHNTPIVVVPAPGAGNMICVIYVASSLGGSVNYTKANDSLLGLGATYAEASAEGNMMCIVPLFAGNVTKPNLQDLNQYSPKAQLDNKALIYTPGDGAGSELTVGDGELHLTVSYMIVAI